MTHAKGDVRHPTRVADYPHRRRPAARRYEDRGLSERLFRDSGDSAHQRRVRRAAVRVLALFGAELDVAEALAIQVLPEQRGDLLGVLVWHEAEVDFPCGFGRDHRLGTGTVVPGLDPADVAGRLEHGRALRLAVASSKGESLYTDDRPHRGRIERHALEQVLIGRGWLADGVVETCDPHATVRAHERSERMREPPCRVRVVRRATRVGVARHGPDAEMAVEDAFAAERQLRPALAIDRAAFFESSVCLGEPRLKGQELREIRATRLLLAFDKEADLDRELAEDCAMSLDRLHTQEEMSLVVVDAARVYGTVALRRLVRRRFPEVEWNGRLDVVVLDADERSFAGAGLAGNERRGAVDPELACVSEARGPKPIAAPAGSGVQRSLVGRFAGDRAELA